MVPSPPPQSDYDIYGMFTLSQFIDEIEKITNSRVIHLHCGDILIYGRNNITDPLPHYINRPVQEAVQLCIDAENVDVEERSLVKPQKAKQPKIKNGTYYFLAWCQGNTSHTYAVFSYI
uniref:Peptidase_M24 domain-containing protein n=1 Tax=Meloidogyne hapla TaxID=6305 RepID=A0A1I8B8L1_MELHA